jgi:Subtilase family/Fervidolysin N-terminal prodomain
MGSRFVPPAAALAAMLAALTVAAPAPSGGTRRAEIIVGFEPHVPASTQAALLGNVGAKTEERFVGIRARLVSVPAGQRGRIAAALARDPRVRYAEPNVRFHAFAQPDDPSYGALWGLDNTGQAVNGLTGTPDADIDAPEAWSVSTGSQSMTVGVIDTGVDYTHPDLAANIWVNQGEDCPGCRTDGVDNDGNGYVDDWRGWDFKNDDNNPFDDHGHGTHIAGTIGALGDNGAGVVGVSWTVKIMPLKFLGADGSGDAADAVRAVNYATLMGAKVTNNSWGGDGFSQALADAIAQADAHGSLFLAAAGNSFTNTDVSPNYPSGYDLPNVLAVAATDQRDARAWFSNYGRRTVDLGAPGVNILSTQPGASYEYLDGTSMATPHVAGAAALAWSAFPSASAVGVKALLLRTVDPNASLAGRTTTGGRLNVGTALACAGTPQAWVEAPASGFAVGVGDELPVSILAASCGDPDAVTVTATVNGAPLTLLSRGDGLYTGALSPSQAGGVTLQVTTASAGGTDVQTVSGSATQTYPIVPGGDPVTVATTAPDENARLTFDGTAGARVSLKLTNVTIGSSAYSSAKVSILRPDGTSLVAPTYFGTSGGFVDTKTLPVTGRYAIVIDPQSTATGSVTLTLYDVPPDVAATLSPGGADATVTVSVPGQNAALTFAGVAGQRVSLALTGVTIGTSGFSSAKVSILNPNGTALVSPTYFGTSGGFVDAKTLGSTGSYTILVDPQSNAVGSATLTLYDVPPDPTVGIVAGGASAALTTIASLYLQRRGRAPRQPEAHRRHDRELDLLLGEGLHPQPERHDAARADLFRHQRVLRRYPVAPDDGDVHGAHRPAGERHRQRDGHPLRRSTGCLGERDDPGARSHPRHGRARSERERELRGVRRPGGLHQAHGSHRGPLVLLELQGVRPEARRDDARRADVLRDVREDTRRSAPGRRHLQDRGGPAERVDRERVRRRDLALVRRPADMCPGDVLGSRAAEQRERQRELLA